MSKSLISGCKALIEWYIRYSSSNAILPLSLCHHIAIVDACLTLAWLVTQCVLTFGISFADVCNIKSAKRRHLPLLISISYPQSGSLCDPVSLCFQQTFTDAVKIYCKKAPVSYLTFKISSNSDITQKNRELNSARILLKAQYSDKSTPNYVVLYRVIL